MCFFAPDQSPLILSIFAHFYGWKVGRGAFHMSVPRGPLCHDPCQQYEKHFAEI